MTLVQQIASIVRGGPERLFDKGGNAGWAIYHIGWCGDRGDHYRLPNAVDSLPSEQKQTCAAIDELHISNAIDHYFRVVSKVQQSRLFQGRLPAHLCVGGRHSGRDNKFCLYKIAHLPEFRSGHVDIPWAAQ